MEMDSFQTHNDDTDDDDSDDSGHLFFSQRLLGVSFIKSNYLNIYNNPYNFANDDKNRSVSSLSSSSSSVFI